MQTRSDHRSRDSLAHGIAKKQKELARVRRDQIAIVGTHRSGGRVLVVDFPSLQPKVLLRQQLRRVRTRTHGGVAGVGG